MKKTLFIIGMLLGVFSLHAQDMKTLFIAMPDSVAPLLTKVNREDCVDFLASNMKAEVKNRFGKLSELKKLTKNYLFMQTTQSSTLEMKLLPLNDSVQVIALVRTVCGPACDSEICFYDTQWQRLDKEDFLHLPSSGAFYLPVDTLTEEAYAVVRGKADMDLLKAVLAEDELTLSFTYTVPDYLAKEERKKLALYMRKEPLVYEWKEGKFRPM
ncbi:DUF3256 family protein [Phocaeicola sp.]|uniref:DUF3256 family protein n=1 Tax=Phocaeicola sp. TaxID=2773926 RepID=UPI0023C6B981|nr:DUF3256 family protein [Phocaeicola sp.]MDE5677007.1 DUF3256 family protein [Phocaeicola sp.]